MSRMEAQTATRRWYLPTPAWLVWGPAVAAGVLYACERWRWFPEHYQKGWPVLLAVAVAAAVMALLPAWMLVGYLFRRRVQFGLRTLLVFVTLCAVVCSWLAVRIKQARRQAEVVASIREKPAGQVWYPFKINDSGGVEYSRTSPKPEPLWKLLGVDFFVDPEWLNLDSSVATEADLSGVAVLTSLTILTFHGDRVTDGEISHVEGLTNLSYLQLDETRVTDERVKKLQDSLPNCQIDVYRGGRKIFSSSASAVRSSDDQ